MEFLREIGIPTPDVFINSIGSGETRARYREALLPNLFDRRTRASQFQRAYAAIRDAAATAARAASTASFSAS